MTKKEIIIKLKDLKPILKDKYNIVSIGFFGSYATGNNTKESDIDIVIEYSKPIGWEFFDIQDLLHEKLNKKIDLVSIKALKKQLKNRILNQTIFI